MNKTFDQECEKGWFEFNPNRSFDERCEIVSCTALSRDMSYEDRLRALRCRFGL